MVNVDKLKVIHFRNLSVQRCNVSFTVNNSVIDTAESYTYLGLLLTEHLDYAKMAKVVGKSASRALGLPIAKCKANRGFQFNVFTKLFDTMVWSVVDYVSAIWGTQQFPCINAVQNRAMRFCMGVGKYTPHLAVAGDMCWKPPLVKQW